MGRKKEAEVHIQRFSKSSMMGVANLMSTHILSWKSRQMWALSSEMAEEFLAVQLCPGSTSFMVEKEKMMLVENQH